MGILRRTSLITTTLALGGVAASTAATPAQADRPLSAIGTPGGGALVVSGTRPNPYDSGDVITVRRYSATADPAAVATLGKAQLLDERASTKDDLLLVRLNAVGLVSLGRLQLVKLSADGRLRTVWSAPGLSSATATLARDGRGRVAVAWLTGPAGNAGQPIVRLATSRDGRTFSNARTVRQRGGKPLGAGALALALDRHGAPVLSIVRSGRPGATTVARISARGTVLSSQRFSTVSGTPSMAQTASGRIALLVHDTGIEGEIGECVGDGSPRRVWAAVAEPGSTRFGAPASLNTQRAYCGDGGAPELLTAPGNAFVVAFGAIPDGTAVPEVRVATAAPGAGFADAPVVWPGHGLAGAAIGPRDGSLVVALDGNPLLSARQGADGALAAPAVLASGTALGTFVPDRVNGGVLATTTDGALHRLP